MDSIFTNFATPAGNEAIAVFRTDKETTESGIFSAESRLVNVPGRGGRGGRTGRARCVARFVSVLCTVVFADLLVSATIADPPDAAALVATSATVTTSENIKLRMYLLSDCCEETTPAPTIGLCGCVLCPFVFMCSQCDAH
jgi:hypothetical protein